MQPNNPLQPTVKKLRFLPSAELARSSNNMKRLDNMKNASSVSYRQGCSK
jgi:hypothetical protein